MPHIYYDAPKLQGAQKVGDGDCVELVQNSPLSAGLVVGNHGSRSLTRGTFGSGP